MAAQLSNAARSSFHRPSPRATFLRHPLALTSRPSPSPRVRRLLRLVSVCPRPPSPFSLPSQLGPCGNVKARTRPRRSLVPSRRLCAACPHTHVCPTHPHPTVRAFFSSLTLTPFVPCTDIRKPRAAYGLWAAIAASSLCTSPVDLLSSKRRHHACRPVASARVQICVRRGTNYDTVAASRASEQK